MSCFCEFLHTHRSSPARLRNAVIRIASLLLVAPVLLVAIPSRAASGDVMVRVRALHVLVPDDSHIPLGGLGPEGTKVLLGDDDVPELDVSFFLTDRLAIEMIAATSRHRVAASVPGVGRIEAGKVSTLPPTLLLQYHLPIGRHFKPYAGVGLNYTILFDSKAAPDFPVDEIHAKDGFGWALQAGADWRLGDSSWFFNIDVKKLFVGTTLKGPGRVPVTKVDLNPWLMGAGFGYRF